MVPLMTVANETQVVDSRLDLISLHIVYLSFVDSIIVYLYFVVDWISSRCTL